MSSFMLSFYLLSFVFLRNFISVYMCVNYILRSFSLFHVRAVTLVLFWVLFLRLLTCSKLALFFFFFLYHVHLLHFCLGSCIYLPVETYSFSASILSFPLFSKIFHATNFLSLLHKRKTSLVKVPIIAVMHKRAQFTLWFTILSAF